MKNLTIFRSSPEWQPDFNQCTEIITSLFGVLGEVDQFTAEEAA